MKKWSYKFAQTEQEQSGANIQQPQIQEQQQQVNVSEDLKNKVKEIFRSKGISHLFDEQSFSLYSSDPSNSNPKKIFELMSPDIIRKNPEIKGRMEKIVNEVKQGINTATEDVTRILAPKNTGYTR
jgi:hypothetical protein